MKHLLMNTCAIALVALASACGDSANTVINVSDDLDPAPGTFSGSTSNGGFVTIVVGSIDRIDLVCNGQTFVGDCNPPVPVGSGGTVMDSCGGVAFDLIFSGTGDSIAGSVSAGSACDGDLQNVIRITDTPPTPVATPTTATTDPTTTPGSSDPTPTPTAGTGPSCSGQSVDVGIAIDSEGVNLAGATVRLDYPTGSVEIPGSIDSSTVQDRVTFLVDAPFTVVNDQDTAPEDGVDDRLNLSATGITPFAPGPFADVSFDCVGPEPSAAQFVCNAVGSDEFGGEVATTCSLTVAVQ